MGKVKTRVLGDPEAEKKQKEEQRARSEEKKLLKKKSGKGELTKQVEASEEAVEKMKKATDLLEKEPATVKDAAVKEKKAKKVKVKVRGKNYQKVKKLVENKKPYPVQEAVKLLKKLKYAKFDESVELHINVDETGLKGEVELPHSTGKTTKVKIVDDKVLAEIEKGKLDFDVLVTHPQYMPKLARFAKVLGPKGLMPNPKAGTISPKPEEVAKKFAKGAIRWKTEPKAPLIHQMIAKVSLEDKAIAENALAFLSAIGKAHVQSVFMKTTMSPSIKLKLD